MAKPSKVMPVVTTRIVVRYARKAVFESAIRNGLSTMLYLPLAVVCIPSAYQA